MSVMEMERSIIQLLRRSPGLSDREITNFLVGRGEPQQYVNQKCNDLKNEGILSRIKREDGIFGNYLVQDSFSSESHPTISKPKSFTIKCACDNGTGKAQGGIDFVLGKDCRKCKGTGRRTLSGSETDYIKDEICDGTGRDKNSIDPWEPCHICDGTGIVKK